MTSLPSDEDACELMRYSLTSSQRIPVAGLAVVDRAFSVESEHGAALPSSVA